jgi:hypothetical protein
MDIRVYEGNIIGGDCTDTYQSIREAIAYVKSLTDCAFITIGQSDTNSDVVLYVWTGETLVDLTR